MMAKVHQQIFVLFALCLALGYCKKCTLGGNEVEVPDTMDCSAFMPVKRPHNVVSELNADQVNVGVERINAQSIRPYFWDGFPFPPNSKFPPRFPGIGWPSHWFRTNRRPVPRPRPPATDIEECPAEGIKFISHPTDCEMYILCVDGEEVAELTCPSGLHFSRELRSCTHPIQAECEDFDFACDPDNDAVHFLPDVSDCEAYFVCFGGNQISMRCASGQHWSFLQNQCMDANDAMCPWEDMEETSQPAAGLPSAPVVGFPSAPVIGQPPAPAQIQRPLVGQQLNKRPNVSNGNGEPIVVPTGTCPDIGVVNAPVQGNCEEFVICINGQAFPRACPQGLHFCQDLLVCVPPEVANCGVSCPSTGVAFLPHEDDCNLYYICFGGSPHLMRCPGDTHWSEENSQCMDPLEAGCEEFDTPAECPEIGVESIPYPYDCERYILCVNGMEIPLQCAPGMHFSPTLRICTAPEIAECEEVARGCPDEDDPTNIVFLPNEEDCNAYYLCWGGNQIPMSCPPGLHWSADENSCMDPEAANCDSGFTCPEEGVENFPHPEECSKFILCVNGQEFARECPPDMEFSPYLRSCMHPDLAGCGGWECPENSNQVVFIPNPEDCSSYFVCFGGQEIPLTCGGGMHWSILDQTCMSPGDANCPFAEDGEEPMEIERCPETGFLAIEHPTSCRQYILCVNGAEVERDCAQGTEFSKESRTCVHPLVANCHSKFTSISAAAFTSHGTCPLIASFEEIVFRPNPDDCEAYFLCLENETIPLRCGEGFHWNASKQKCMSRDQAHCRA